MKKLAVLALVPILPLFLFAQSNSERTRFYTQPKLPTRDVLDRLNLNLSWRTFVPTDGQRDGIFSIQLAPVREGKTVTRELLVQTRSGVVIALDADSGVVKWRTRVGNPYLVTQALGFNDRVIVTSRGLDLFGVNRKNGEVLWKMLLDATLSTPPVLDDRFLFICQTANRVTCFDAPGNPEQDKPRWSERSPEPLEFQPLMTRDTLILPTPTGSVAVFAKDIPKIYARIRTQGRLLAAPGIHEADAFIYIASADANVYGEQIEQVTKDLSVRFTAGGAITRTPVVNDNDVFATTERQGLYRLHRRNTTGDVVAAQLIERGIVEAAQMQKVQATLKERAKDSEALLNALQNGRLITPRQRQDFPWKGGEAVWQNQDADRVLAVNPKFVYATDRSGRLLILDRARGKELSSYNLRDYVVPVTNELTDRVYLAANNGLIVCLHDKDYRDPHVMKRIPELAVPKPSDPKDAPKDPPKDPKDPPKDPQKDPKDPQKDPKDPQKDPPKPPKMN